MIPDQPAQLSADVPRCSRRIAVGPERSQIEPFRPPHGFDCQVCYPPGDVSLWRLGIALFLGVWVVAGFPVVHEIVRWVLRWWGVLP